MYENLLTPFNQLGAWVSDGVDWIGNQFTNQTDKNGNEIANSSPFAQSLPGKIVKGISTPIGSGENASSPLQWGIAGLGLWNQKKQFDTQLDEARRQFAFSKGNTQANFMNQGTNFINQGLWQIEALNAFNPNAAAERAQNFGTAIAQMNDAASKIELGPNTFGKQQDALQKYSQLGNNARLA